MADGALRFEGLTDSQTEQTQAGTARRKGRNKLQTANQTEPTTGTEPRTTTEPARRTEPSRRNERSGMMDGMKMDKKATATTTGLQANAAAQQMGLMTMVLDSDGNSDSTLATTASTLDEGSKAQVVMDNASEMTVTHVAQNRAPGHQLPASQRADRGVGLPCKRLFTTAGVNPFDEVLWDRRTASITNTKGETIFEQKNVEFPSFWSQTATAVVVSKYFRGTLGTPEREYSVRQLIGRVVGTIGAWARQGQYFDSEESTRIFEDELTWMLLQQRMAFNSPVWFNVGVEKQPQCSACFINSVEDTMESILTLAKTEGMLFKYGSGTGSNLSPIRSSREQLAGGGTASGPVSFMKGFDAFAGVIKSGGKTRRAAKMVILNVDHPDILEFIRCKESEEKKAWALIEAGYDSRIDGEAYTSVFFQNSNNSVRVTDAFMKAVENNEDWTTRAVKDGRPMDTMPAQDVMNTIAESTWLCGDPGM